MPAADAVLARPAQAEAPAARPAPAPAPAPPTRARSRTALVALVGLAAALRLPTLGRAYWVDEGISIGIAGHPLAQIPGLLRLDGSPPLFYVLLHVWIGLFGRSQALTHLLPLLCSLVVIPVAYWAARALCPEDARLRERAGWCAAVLAATNPFLNWYATETRMYPLVCLEAMVAVTLAHRAARRHSWPDAAGAALAFTALLYTHNWGFYLCAATAGVVAVQAVRRRDWSVVAGCGLVGVVVGLLYAPWLPSFWAQAHHTAAPWAVSPSPGDLVSDPASILGGTLGAVVEPVLVVCAGLAWWLRPGATASARFATVVGATALAVGWVAAQVEPSWATRYLAVGLGPLLVGLAVSAATSRSGRCAVAGVAALLVGWSVVGALLPDRNARFAKSNVAAVAGAAAPLLAPGDLVVVTQTEQTAALAHYLPAGLRYTTPTGPVADPGVVDWRDLVPRLAAADPCAVLSPQVGALPVGGHVLVVNPLRRIGSSGTRWSRTVAADVVADNRLLYAATGLRPIARLAPAIDPKPFSAVTGLLYVKSSPTPLCP